MSFRVKKKKVTRRQCFTLILMQQKTTFLQLYGTGIERKDNRIEEILFFSEKSCVQFFLTIWF